MPVCLGARIVLVVAGVPRFYDGHRDEDLPTPIEYRRHQADTSQYLEGGRLPFVDALEVGKDESAQASAEKIIETQLIFLNGNTS